MPKKTVKIISTVAITAALVISAATAITAWSDDSQSNQPFSTQQ